MSPRLDQLRLEAHYWAEKELIAEQVHQLVIPLIEEARQATAAIRTHQVTPDDIITAMHSAMKLWQQTTRHPDYCPHEYRPRFPTPDEPVTRLHVDVLRSIRAALTSTPDSTTSRPYIVSWRSLSPGQLAQEMNELVELDHGCLSVQSIAARQQLDLPRVRVPTVRQLLARRSTNVPDNVRELHPIRRAQHIAQEKGVA